MHEMYQHNAKNKSGGKWIVSYQGINEETFQQAKSKHGLERKPFSILSVSAMAHWKGAETLLNALKILHQNDIPATVTFVGPWPDESYRQQIEKLIDHLQIRSHVSILGKVSTEDLQLNYATHQVYCLMSQCESFGIPAVEAQAFGTPVIGATGCAMPEIGGHGGKFCPPHDVKQTSSLLEECLTNKVVWNNLSNNSLANTERFHWDECSKPLIACLLGNNIDQHTSCRTDAIVPAEKVVILN
jgi:glycosyltransferase involved in cell wall biosynthesis